MEKIKTRPKIAKEWAENKKQFKEPSQILRVDKGKPMGIFFCFFGGI
jgi:hypothetical protein